MLGSPYRTYLNRAAKYHLSDADAHDVVYPPHQKIMEWFEPTAAVITLITLYTKRQLPYQLFDNKPHPRGKDVLFFEGMNLL
jgi:hypothetical protein